MEEICVNASTAFMVQDVKLISEQNGVIAKLYNREDVQISTELELPLKNSAVIQLVTLGVTIANHVQFIALQKDSANKLINVLSEKETLVIWMNLAKILTSVTN